MIDKLENYLGKLSDTLNKISKVILGIIVGTMFLIIITQVILRYIFSGGFSWAEEVTVFFMAWMTFLGSAIAVKQAEHINIDILVHKFSGKVKWTIILISKLIILFFIFIFLYYGYQFAINSINFSSNVLGIPLIYPRISITISCVIIVIHLVHSLIADLSEVKN